MAEELVGDIRDLEVSIGRLKKVKSKLIKRLFLTYVKPVAEERGYEFEIKDDKAILSKSEGNNIIIGLESSNHLWDHLWVRYEVDGERVNVGGPLSYTVKGFISINFLDGHLRSYIDKYERKLSPKIISI